MTDMPNWANDRTLWMIAEPAGPSPARRQFLVFLVPNGKMPSPFLSHLDAARNFDLAVRFYDKPGVNEGLLKRAEYVMTGGLSKFHAAALFLEAARLQNSYDGYLFLDGDLEFDASQLSRFLAICHLADLQLSQPAVTRDSYCEWKMVFHQPGFIFRQTSFVEVMAPYMSRNALAETLHTFTLSISSYGLDFVWPKLIGRRRIGVVDAFQIRHGERVDFTDGPFYRYLSSLGVDFSEEARRVEAMYGVTRVQPHSQRGYFWKKGHSSLASRKSVRSVFLPRIERMTNNQRLIDVAVHLAALGPERVEVTLTEALGALEQNG